MSDKSIIWQENNQLSKAEYKKLYFEYSKSLINSHMQNGEELTKEDIDNVFSKCREIIKKYEYMIRYNV